jgi:Domain of unknown function (DUF6265)
MRSLVFLVALLWAPFAGAQTLADLAWLKGCWRTVGAELEVTEVWVAPPMPALLGYAYTTADGQTRGWEHTRIEMIDGWPHFVAMPGGAPAVAFRLVEPDPSLHIEGRPDHVAVFNNSVHDYPQTVAYMRYGDRLRAMTAGADGADPVFFEYRRIRCTPNLRP